MRQIPGARHDAKRQLWTLPLSWATCVVARGVIGATLEIGPRLAEWARAEQAGRIAPSLALRDAPTLPPTSPWAAVIDELEADCG